MDSQQLRAVIASAKSNRPEGYGALLEAYGPRLYGFFVRATSSHHDAEDMLGEIMLRLVRRLKDYDERGRFEPWLFRIAANMVRDRIRRQKVRPSSVSLSGDGRRGTELGESLAASGPAAEALIMAAERAQELNEALMRLDARTREMILLRHFGQMSFKEIADLLQCPLGTVLARVHRGMRTLRKLMETHNASQ